MTAQWKGVNLAHIARTVQSAMSGTEAGEGGGATDFAELAATFRVADGVAATEDLRLLNPYVRMQGAGLVNIGAQTIDMRIEPRAVNNAQGQGGEAGVQGIGIPFRVSGAWASPSFRPALGDVVQNELRNRARDILSNQDENNPLTKLGKSLFGRQASETPTSGQTTTPAPAASEGKNAPPPADAEKQKERPLNPLEELLRRGQQANP